MSADGGPRWLIAYPKENIQHFDPVVHLQAVCEGIRYLIVDLAEEQTGKNYQNKLGHIMPEITQYWPSETVQLLAKMLGYDFKNPSRCSRGCMPGPDLEASVERTDEVDDVSSNRGPTGTPRFDDEKK